MRSGGFSLAASPPSRIQEGQQFSRGIPLLSVVRRQEWKSFLLNQDPAFAFLGRAIGYRWHAAHVPATNDEVAHGGVERNGAGEHLAKGQLGRFAVLSGRRLLELPRNWQKGRAVAGSACSEKKLAKSLIRYSSTAGVVGSCSVFVTWRSRTSSA